MRTITLYLFLLIITLFTSCDKEETPQPDTERDETSLLVAYNELPSLTLSSSIIKISIRLATIGGQYSELSSIIDDIKYGVKGYKITYTTTYNGLPITASGLIILPQDTDNKEISIISMHNVTIISKSDAPTENISDLDYKMLYSIPASLGFVIFIPDYIGFGSSKDITPPPFLHKESVEHTVIDMIKAGKEFLTKHYDNIKLSNKLYLGGYSQGGYSTLVAHKKIETLEEFDLDLVASSCGGGIYDIEQTLEKLSQLETYNNPFYFVYLEESYRSLGEIAVPRSEIFREPYSENISPEWFDGTLDMRDINRELTSAIPQLLQPDALAKIKTSLKNNSVTSWESLQNPIRFYHGEDDDVIPYSASKNIHYSFISDKVTLIRLEGKNHETGFLPTIISTIKWFLELDNQ